MSFWKQWPADERVQELDGSDGDGGRGKVDDDGRKRDFDGGQGATQAPQARQKVASAEQ